jgi:pimeloyl-ACP methyl ester carboxylesterase
VARPVTAGADRTLRLPDGRTLGYGDLAAPVELWQGDADELVPMRHAEDLAAALPAATLHPCPGEGHLVMVTHAEEILHAAAQRRGSDTAGVS